MQVSVDRDLCQGHGMCVEEAPDVFALGKHDDQVTILQAQPDEALRDAVKRAVTYCPAAALSMRDCLCPYAETEFSMPVFDRAELDDFWQSWLDTNRKAQEIGDWSILAELFAPDASYGWSYSATDQFMATGRDEIRELALGAEMLGFQGWVYPYQASVIDDRNGLVVGFWRQLTTFPSPSGEPYEIQGLGCSWFQYGGDQQWAWQRDIFDASIAQVTVMKLIQDGNMSPQLQRRIEKVVTGNQPGHYPSVDAMSSPLWPIPAIRA